jgi:signal transduction histidine kinase
VTPRAIPEVGPAPDDRAAPGGGPASSRYVIYAGRHRRTLRLAVLVVITAVVALDHPSPSLHGSGLAVLAALVVAVAAQLADAAFPGRAVPARVAVEAVASGVLVGIVPNAAIAFALWAGLDAGALLGVGPGTWAVAAGVVAELLTGVVDGQPPTRALYALLIVGGFLAATTVRQYILRAEQAELRLADAQRAELERARAVQLAERAEAAREIHDILAHHLGALVVQLDAADALLSTEPARVDAARPLVRQAHELAVAGLDEARSAVANLRGDRRDLLASLQQLSDTAGARLVVAGQPRPLAPEIQQLLRRCLQESLTNATKHAPGASVEAHLDFASDRVTLRVTDDGARQAPPAWATTGGGYGLAGMRERAIEAGAELTVGPSGPGWQVRVCIPDRGGDKEGWS